MQKCLLKKTQIMCLKTSFLSGWKKVYPLQKEIQEENIVLQVIIRKTERTSTGSSTVDLAREVRNSKPSISPKNPSLRRKTMPRTTKRTLQVRTVTMESTLTQQRNCNKTKTQLSSDNSKCVFTPYICDIFDFNK